MKQVNTIRLVLLIFFILLNAPNLFASSSITIFFNASFNNGDTLHETAFRLSVTAVDSSQTPPTTLSFVKYDFTRLALSGSTIVIDSSIIDSIIAGKDTVYQRTTQFTYSPSESIESNIMPPNQHKTFSDLDTGYYQILVQAGEDTTVFDSLRFVIDPKRYPLSAKTWNMLAIPHRIDSLPTWQSLLGTSSLSFRWQENSPPHPVYLNYVSIADSIIGSGHAAWVRSDGNTMLDVTSHPYLPKDTTVTISLQKGWNQIGNPFRHPIKWNDIYAKKPGMADSITISNLAAVQKNPLDSLTTPLDSMHLIKTLYWYENKGYSWSRDAQFFPWQGYLVYAETSYTLYLVGTTSYFPDSVQNFSKAFKTATSDQWLIKLSVTTPYAEDNINYIGVHPAASTGFERYDVREPLGSFGTYIGLFMTNNGTTPPLAADIKHNSDKQPVWNITITGNTFNEPVSLTWERRGLVADLYLIDQSSHSMVNMNTASDYEFILNTSGSNEFIITNKRHDYARQLQKPLVQVFPNPFTKHASITYRIPLEHVHARQLSLIIYDMAGNVIQIYTTSEITTMEHQISLEFSGSDQVYFYRLFTDTGLNSKGKILSIK